MKEGFSYDGIWSSKSKGDPVANVKHAKYDFAVAYPPPETLPLYALADALRKEIDARADEVSKEMAYYPDRLGHLGLRDFTVQKLERERGFTETPDRVVLTAGSGEAISLLIQALIDPGDTVVTEEYVYLGTLNQLRFFGATPVTTPIDVNGIVPDKLDAVLSNLKTNGTPPKFIYTIPEHQNPTGSTLPVERKKQILNVAHKFGIPIIEDECYVDLRFEGKAEPSFRSLDDSGMVIHVGSFSKLIAPGLRLGFFTATDEVINRALSFKHGSGPNQFVAYAVNGFLRGAIEEHRNTYNPLLKAKRDAMIKGLEDHFGDSNALWSKPEGGCYLWLEMPPEKDISSVRDDVFAEGVGYIAGVNFSPDGHGKNCARLCFAFESVEKNYAGIACLAEIFKSRGLL